MLPTKGSRRSFVTDTEESTNASTRTNPTVIKHVSSLATFGHTLRFGATALAVAGTDTRRLHLQWRETLAQSWFLLKVTLIPGVLMAIPFGIIVSAQVGNIVNQLGANALVGAAGGLGVIKQGAPLATGLLLAGAGAAAIAADLGARKVREEVDAMQVMGIDPVSRLVVPRMLAMLIVAPILNVAIMVIGMTAGYLVAVRELDVTPGSYWDSFGTFATASDVWVSLVKALIFGMIVVVIACQRGLSAQGGPGGVAAAVNAAVILSVVAIAVVNVAITQVVAILFPTRFV